ncbi:hypothetical protein NDU88_000211 [Pleurodeles waltl]|uniref:Uncharacterized protein n=1 Tax=Pleurodeles waltl TaxID=8319 RepID=A0AAV7TET3_PLEWA|nr:hypothetical protein NDU88_000211 [Pleurodeles waltl]
MGSPGGSVQFQWGAAGHRRAILPLCVSIASSVSSLWSASYSFCGKRRPGCSPIAPGVGRAQPGIPVSTPQVVLLPHRFRAGREASLTPILGPYPKPDDQRRPRRPPGVSAGRPLSHSGRARSPCPSLLQFSDTQSFGAPRPLAVVGSFPRPQVGRAYRCSYPPRGAFLLLGRGSSGQTRSGTPAARPAVRFGSGMAGVFTQDPGSGRGMGRRLLSSPAQLAQLEPTTQGRDGGSAAPKTTPPGYHLIPGTDRPGEGTLYPDNCRPLRSEGIKRAPSLGSWPRPLKNYSS